MVTLRLAGPFTVERDGSPVPAVEVGSRKARTLLKLLAVHRRQLLSTDRISAVLWPGPPPRHPAENIATLVSRLRSALGAGLVTGDRDGYQLGGVPAAEVDLDQVAERLAEARRRAAAGEPALSGAAAQGALGMLGDGPVLADDPYADWAEPARAEAATLLQAARQLASEAALALADPATAGALAEAMTAADPYDEVAYRLLMRAEAARGRPARALAGYERLRERLATDFGVDPAPATREVHLAVLREQPPPSPAPAATAPRTALAGRDAELARLTDAWHRAAAGQPTLLLVTGEAGIGKTRLATELVALAEQTGGTVLTVRCYESDRSLFLQPLVEAIGQHAARTRSASTGDADLAALVPQIAALHPGYRPPAAAGGAEVARQRAYQAVTRYLGRLASSPVLLLLDDLQNAGLSTVELLHYLARHAGAARLLVAATVRAEEGAPALRALAGVAERLDLGPLPTAAVRRLATEAGHADLADTILRRTRGHTLFVVETLRGLTAGEAGIPESLREAVLARVERTGSGVAELLRAAAVLGAVIDPVTLGRLLGIPPAPATQRCEAALAARLLVVAGRTYEFANDLVREVLYEALPVPSRVAYHRQAADLLGDRPAAVAGHAAAAGDLNRAARAYLVAGEEASRRYAGAEALALLTSAVEAGQELGDLEVTGRARLARGRIRDAQRNYPPALDDFRAAAGLARQAGDRRLEMMALRELAGDVPLALGLSIVDSEGHLRTGLRIAESLADRRNETDLLGRLAVIASSRLNFIEALSYGQRAVASARASGDELALAAALDGLKTGYAYLGAIGPLTEILDELEPLLRRQGDLWRLQWTVQEAAFPAIAAGRFDEALTRVGDALEINRRSGYAAYEGWFIGHLGWVHRLRGDLPAALEHGRRALELTRGSTHAWWRAAACAQSAATLLAAGDHPAQAVALLEEGAALADRAGAEAYSLRCLGPLAELSGSAALLSDVDSRLGRIPAPAGSAWLLGADAYAAVGRAWLARGEPERAEALLGPVRAAARRHGWVWLEATLPVLTG